MLGVHANEMNCTTLPASPKRSKNSQSSPKSCSNNSTAHTIPTQIYVCIYRKYLSPLSPPSLSLYGYAIVIILSPVPHSQHIQTHTSSLTRITFCTRTNCKQQQPLPFAAIRVRGLTRSQSRSHACLRAASQQCVCVCVR